MNLQERCEQLRSLHARGDPLLLPNVWDIPTARAVVAAGFPVVATTSWGVAASIGHEDDERAPADEMLAAAARIAGSVEVPVTIDAEAGYGMEPTALVAALRDAGAAGCNIEDTDHRTSTLRDVGERANYVAVMRAAADADDYPLVINARTDGFLWPYVAAFEAGSRIEPGSQLALVPEAIERAQAYLDAGADCVYPIALWEPDALRAFMAEIDAPVNISKVPEMDSLDEVTALGVARVSWAIFLYEEAMGHFAEQLVSLRG
jgi:2-methylisocitrate lyase-like PEP mutase family enzyme